MSLVPKKTVECPICKNETKTILSSELRRGGGKVFYCDYCDHGFIDSESQVDLEKYYAHEYRKEFSHFSATSSTNASEIYEVYKKYYRYRDEEIKKYCMEDSRLLEVGASSGQFLVHIKDKVDTVNAIELDQSCYSFLQEELGINSDYRVLEHSKFAQNSYDIICTFHVMEHVKSPVKFLETLKSVASEKANIFIEVPCLKDPLLSVWDVPEYKKFFYHTAHLQYFSEKSLTKVANMAGFQDDQIKISYFQDYNLLNHLHWIMNGAPQNDCHIGLSDILLNGKNQKIALWLSDKLSQLNNEYVEKLTEEKATSNIFMKLACE